MSRQSKLLLFVLTALGCLQSLSASCPPVADEDRIYYCQDPQDILTDSTVKCDPTTCRWDVNALDPNQPPVLCLLTRMEEDDIDTVQDLLEPCLWWEIMYGRLQHVLPEFLGVPTGDPVTFASSGRGKFGVICVSFCR